MYFIAFEFICLYLLNCLIIIQWSLGCQMTHLGSISSQTKNATVSEQNFGSKTDEPATTFSKGQDIQRETVSYTAASVQSDSLWNRHSRGGVFCSASGGLTAKATTNQESSYKTPPKKDEKKMGKVSQISLEGVLAPPLESYLLKILAFIVCRK